MTKARESKFPRKEHPRLVRESEGRPNKEVEVEEEPEMGPKSKGKWRQGERLSQGEK